MARLLATSVAALACALLATPAPPAFAADDSTYYGSCGFSAVTDPLAPEGTFTGWVDAQVVLYSRTHGNAVAATVTCELRVNGVAQDSATASGLGAVIIADTLSYRADVVDWVQICTIVDFTSDTTPTAVFCPGPTTLEFPPQWVQDLFSMTAYADGVACPLLQQVSPGAGPVVIDAQGDVYVSDELWWDCPPYQDGSEPPPPPDTRTPSGAGYNDGTTGFLALTSPAPSAEGSVAALCAYSTANGVATVHGVAVAAGSDTATATRIGCRLEDEHGNVLYDDSATSAGGSASLAGSAPVSGTVTVCTEATGWFGARAETVGRHCRLGVPA